MLQGQQSPGVRALPAHSLVVFEPVTIVPALLMLSIEKPSSISHITVTPSGTTSSGSAVDQEHS